MHEGPGLIQPDGVAPGVSHRLEGVPGENGLLLSELDPVILSVISEIRKIQGDVQGTFGFHDPFPTPRGGVIVLPETGTTPPIPIKAAFKNNEKIVKTATEFRKVTIISLPKRSIKLAIRSLRYIFPQDHDKHSC